MMEWMLMPFRRYVEFSGRSRRKEYWMFVLFNLIVYFVLALLFGAYQVTPEGEIDFGPGPMLLSLYALIAFLPSLAVVVRRFHDQDKTGWLALLALIPFIGGLIVLVFMVIEGTRGPNRYGPDPKTQGPALS